MKNSIPLYLCLFFLLLSVGCRRQTTATSLPYIPEVPYEESSVDPPPASAKLIATERDIVRTEKYDLRNISWGSKSAKDLEAMEPKVVYEEYVSHVYEVGEGVRFIVGHKLSDACSECGKEPIDR